ncbi:MAG: chorismate synthase [Rhodospirillales bacterium]|nr:chorismate synthase [Rhodospirillales bacterium]
MSGNRFGTLFQYTTFGESHGPAIGVIVDGVPPRIPLDEGYIQGFLDKRKPGQSRHTTQRKEPDTVEILSGVFEGLTTGTPIGLLIRNQDQKSKDYSDIKDKFRPGHADFTYMQKYGIRDYRGGGRSSARETACRVAAGAVARKVLESQIGVGVQIRAGVVQVGEKKINRDRWDWDQVGQNPLWLPDAEAVTEIEEYLDRIRKDGSSAGALVEVHASGIPAGLGAPVYDKLDADLAKAMMSINAVKAVEIGAGFEAVSLRGEDNADEIRISSSPPLAEGIEGGRPQFQSNNAGGILGGISSGQDIVCRVAFKPTSSILTPVKTIDKDGNETDIVTKGRHDPCVGLRGTPVVEAMMACVLADHWLRHKAQCL